MSFRNFDWNVFLAVVAVSLSIVAAVQLVQAREAYTPPKGCTNLMCTMGAINGVNGVYSTGTAPREQFLVGDDGYCGETTVQVSMVKHGVWLPQEFVRVASTGSRTGDVLVETKSYKNMPEKLKINMVQCTKGGYEGYIAFLKSWLVRGVGCAMVFNFKESDNTDGTYDHIVPVTGIITKTPGGGYDKNDILMVHTNFVPDESGDGKPIVVNRKVGDFRCESGGRKAWKNARLDNAGCVPRRSLKGYAWAFGGPKYVGIGPGVELVMHSPREPGKSPRDAGTMKATLVVRGLTPRKTYKLYMFKDPNKVPGSPKAKVNGTPWKTFTANGAVHKEQVSFPSNEPRYFIAIAA